MTYTIIRNVISYKYSLKKFLVRSCVYTIFSIGIFVSGQITNAQIKHFAKVENQIGDLRSTDSLLAIKLNTHLFDVFREMQFKKNTKQSTIMFQQYGKDDFLQITQDGFIQVEIGVPKIEEHFQKVLESVGFKTEYSNNKFHRYFGSLPLQAILEVVKLEFVNFIRAVERPLTNEITTEGDVQHKAYYSRNLWGISGNGRKVGIISDGVDNRQSSINAGELPSSLQVINNRQGGDEGTAMLEIVHDLAPSSTLVFADHGNSEADFANNINLLSQTGCNIICDDIIYFHEPAFEDGIIAQAVDQFFSSGGLYTSSAGNYRKGHYIGNFENDGNNFSKFLLSSGYANYLPIALTAGATVQVWLQWNDPYGSSGNDYDLYLYDDISGNKIASSWNFQLGLNDPYEILSYTNSSSSIQAVDVAVYNAGLLKIGHNAAPRKFQIWAIVNGGTGGTVYQAWQKHESSSFGHSAAIGCISVAAITGENNQETFSSEGPVLIYSFDSNNNPTTHVERIKPDISARDGVQTYVGLHGNFDNPFFGTSAAAPHVAGIAALTWATDPSKRGSQIGSILKNTATNLPSSNSSKNNQYGEGTVDAKNAISQILSLPHIVLNSTTFNFSCMQNSSLPSTQTLNISNTGGGTSELTISDNAGWLEITPTNGRSNNLNATVKVNTTSLSPGTYNATITVSSTDADNTPQLASVNYVVNGSVGPTLIAVTASLNPSSTTTSQVVNVSGGAIYNTGKPVTSGTVTIAVINGESWTATIDANGNFNRNITAPAVTGNYTVRTTVSDGTKSGFIDNALSVSGGQGNPSAYKFYRATVCEDVQSNTPYDPFNETRWIRSSFTRVNVWVHLTDLYKSVRVKWEWYKPDGSLWNSTYSDWTTAPASGYYYLWWKMWSNWTVSGTEFAIMEGEWSVKVFVQESGGSFIYHDTQYFTIRYNFTEHQMAQDVQSSDPYLPINPTNTFYQTGSKALTWMNLDDVAEGLDVRWDYYEPNGSLFNTFSYTIPDPGIGYYYPWSRAWGWINIAGNATASKTGNWKVDVFIKDPFGSFDKKYTDYFQILESPNVPPSISDGLPTSITEATNIGIPISVSDNANLQKVELYWTDQTQHNVVLADNIFNNIYSTTYNIGTYTEGTQVRYFVRAYDVSGNVTESPQRVITILDSDTQGPQITSVVVEEYNGNGDNIIMNNEQVKISWNVSDPSGINSVVVTVDGQNQAVISNTYSISGSYTVGEHSVQIIATDNDNSPSTSLSSTNFLVWSIPSGVSLVSPINASLNVSIPTITKWNKIPNATKYWFELSEDSTFSSENVQDSSLIDTTKIINNIFENAKYYWRVKAKNIAGWGSFSQKWYFNTIITVPSAPTNLSALVVNSNQINITWQDNAANETSYKIEQKTGASGTYSGIATLAANVTSYSNSNLTDGTQYYYRIYAYNNAGNSNYSNESNAITPMNVPTNLAAAAISSNQVNLGWQDNSGSENGYRIERKAGVSGTYSEITTVGTNVTSYDNTGLTENTTYYYRIIGYNSLINSGYSNEANVTTSISLPTSPTNLTATASDSNLINLSWTDNATNETGYKVERKTGSSGPWSVISNLPVGSTSYSNSNLTDGTQYYYRIYAYNNAGNSNYSNESNAITPMNVPTNLAAAAISSNQVNLGWQDNSGSENGYRIERKVGVSGTYSEITTVESNVTTYNNNTDLTENTTYYYRVRGYNSLVNSNYSNEANVTTQGPTSVEHISELNPNSYFLSYNFPNPFNPSTNLRFGLPSRSRVTIVVFNILGQIVSTLVENKFLEAGIFNFNWPVQNKNGSSLPTGIYFVRMTAEPEDNSKQTFSEVRKILMIK